MKIGELIFFCGKMGAGKSTKSLIVTQEKNAVLLSEDDWLASLYPNQIKSISDYANYSARLKPKIKTLAQSILSTGTNVVMDFPANTLAQRTWFKTIYVDINAPHTLYYIESSNSLCLERVTKRAREQSNRADTDTKEIFDACTKHFLPPEQSEGFNVVKIPTQ